MRAPLQSMTLAGRAEEVAQRCEQARLHGQRWQARCPAHDDRSPSLSITPGDKAVLLTCHAKCPTEAVLAALGLTMADLFVDPPATNGHKRIVAVYPYVDSQGTIVHETVRYEPKEFRQRRPDPAHPGDYIWQEVFKDLEPVLYNLPAVLAAVQHGDTIYIVEGEKDAETLTRQGLTATTNAMGAGKWRQSYTDTLRGASVVLLPDNDPQGRTHMAHVKASLAGHVARLQVVVLPLLPPKGDVTAWLQSGHTLDDFHREVQQTPADPTTDTPAPLAASVVFYPELLTLDIAPRARYLPWLLESSIVMLYGPRGVGKTMALLGLSVSLTTGQPFLKWPLSKTVGVLYVDGEMALDELRCRTKTFAEGTIPACLAFLPSELVYTRSHRDLTLTKAAYRQELEEYLESQPALKVLVLDNVSCLFPGLDENKKQDWEPVAAWFIRLRHRGITVIFGHHSGKGGLQRGTSGREDAVDTVIALSAPPGYQAKDGCHFYWKFTKARGVKGEAVEMLDVRLEHDGNGLTTWTYCLVEQTTKDRVKELLLDKVPAQAIAHELGVSWSYVYRIKRDTGL